MSILLKFRFFSKLNLRNTNPGSKRFYEVSWIFSRKCRCLPETYLLTFGKAIFRWNSRRYLAVDFSNEFNNVEWTTNPIFRLIRKLSFFPGNFSEIGQVVLTIPTSILLKFRPFSKSSLRITNPGLKRIYEVPWLFFSIFLTVPPIRKRHTPIYVPSNWNECQFPPKNQ
mgnify:FL=1